MMDSISEHDAAVLSRVFSPEDPFQPADCCDATGAAPDEAVDEEERALRAEERQAVACAEAGNLTSAMDQLNGLVLRHPARASLFNNRAQVLQLLGDRKGALADVHEALRLCGIDQLDRIDPQLLAELRRGPAQRRNTATQALTQCGVLLRVDECEARALLCFRAAAELGGQFARQMAVQMNPYAALCGSMLSQVFDRLQRGLPEDGEPAQ